MSESNRRFFSGNTIQQAVMAAASAYGLDPREVNFRPVEKKRGFLKTRKRIIIEVDQEQPRLEQPREDLFNDGPKGIPPIIGVPVPGREPAKQSEQEAEKPKRSPKAPAKRRTKKVELLDVAEIEEDPSGVEEVEVAEDSDSGGQAEEVREPGGRRGRGGRPSSDRSDGRRTRRGSGDEGGSPEASSDSEEPAEGRRPRGRQRTSEPKNEAASARTPKKRPAADDRKGRPDRIEGLSAEEEALARLLDLADLELDWEIWWEDDVLHVDLSGPDAEFVLEEEGSTLYALEHLLPQVIRGINGEDIFCQVDCDGFREDREEELRKLARDAAQWVVDNDQEKTLRDLNPAERRIVHMELADHTDVETESEGRGFLKRLTVWPI